VPFGDGTGQEVTSVETVVVPEEVDAVRVYV
jgi:hypothetical protein